MEEKRFSGVIGEEYELRKQVMPHYPHMQNTVGTLVKLLYGRGRNSLVGSIHAIDLGCGTGSTSKAVLDNLPRGCIWAVDNESVMLKQAEENLQEYSNRIVFIKEDILKYLEHQPSESFDVIVSAQTLHNFSQTYRESVLEQIYKTLNRGGVFINADKYALDDEIAHQKSLDAQLERIKSVFGNGVRPDLVEARTTHCLRDNEPDLIMKQQAAIDQMTKIGFEDIITVYREEMDAILVAVKPG